MPFGSCALRSVRPERDGRDAWTGPSPSAGKQLSRSTRQEVTMESRPRDYESAYYALPSSPRVALSPSWPCCSPPHDLPDVAPWAQLRILLPDSCGAQSGARREALWQRFCGGAATTVAGADTVELEALLHHIELLALRNRVILVTTDDAPRSDSRDRRELFLNDAIRAAAEYVGTVNDAETRYVDSIERGTFRVFVMRMHQFLDVAQVLNDGDSETAVNDPRQTIGFAAFVKVLEKRAHTMLLDPEDPTSLVRLQGTAAATAIFERLCGVGKTKATFARVARWSMRCQLVRPGSGALVPQPRFPTHWTEPASAGTYGACHSARGRKLSGSTAAKSHRHAPVKSHRHAPALPTVGPTSHRQAPPIPAAATPTDGKKRLRAFLSTARVLPAYRLRAVEEHRRAWR